MIPSHSPSSASPPQDDTPAQAYAGERNDEGRGGEGRGGEGGREGREGGRGGREGGEGRGGEGREGGERKGGEGRGVGRKSRKDGEIKTSTKMSEYGCGVYLLRIAVPFDQRLHVH